MEGMAIGWSCGSCRATGFVDRDAMRAHRAEAHPELEAGAVAFAQVVDLGGTDDEAQEAYDKAVKEYREAVSR